MGRRVDSQVQERKKLGMSRFFNLSRTFLLEPERQKTKGRTLALKSPEKKLQTVSEHTSENLRGKIKVF